jgi:hypothetical protein
MPSGKLLHRISNILHHAQRPGPPPNCGSDLELGSDELVRGIEQALVQLGHLLDRI